MPGRADFRNIVAEIPSRPPRHSWLTGAFPLSWPDAPLHNYARVRGRQAGENPTIGPILCVQTNAAIARYAMEGLPNKVLAAEYRTALPKERLLGAEVNRTRAAIERARASANKKRRRRRWTGE